MMDGIRVGSSAAESLDDCLRRTKNTFRSDRILRQLLLGAKLSCALTHQTDKLSLVIEFDDIEHYRSVAKAVDLLWQQLKQGEAVAYVYSDIRLHFPGKRPIVWAQPVNPC